MGLVVTDLAGQKSNEALSIISKLIKGQPKLQKALQQCTEMHKNVIKYDLPLIKDAIRGNPKFAETAMVDVGAEASNCDAALAGNKVPDLNNVNKYMITLAEVGRAIIRNLL